MVDVSQVSGADAPDSRRQICPQVDLTIQDGAQLIRYGESNVLLLSNHDAAQEERIIERWPNLHVDILKAAGEAADQLNSSKVLNSLQPSYVIVTAGLPIASESGRPGVAAIERLSASLTAKQRPTILTSVLACERSNGEACQWKSILVHENLLLTNQGDVAFLLRPSGVQLVEEAAPQISVDCRVKRDLGGRKIMLSRFSRHTGILIPRADLKLLKLAEDRIPKEPAWVDISWGDETLFLGDEASNTIQNYIAAGWMNRPAALRITATDADDLSTYMSVTLDEVGYESLLNFIAASIKRQPDGATIDRTSFAAPQLRASDTIYLAANNIVPIPRSCNRWTAIALSHAGCDSWPSIVLTNSQLWEVMRRIGK